MTLEFEARAMGVSDSHNGKRVLVFRTTNGQTIKITVHENQADFAVRQIGAQLAHD